MHKTQTNNKAKILIAENETLLTSFYEHILNTHGNYIVHVAHTAKLTVDKAKQLYPDILIMDLSLQRKLDGLDAVKKIREFCFAPIIYITGH